MLFECPELVSTRNVAWRSVTQCLPNTMSQYINMCSNQQKCEFVLSRLNGTYVHEWDEIYLKIVWFVNEMYTMRLRLYGRMEPHGA